jgi:hypothetical protein
MAAGRLIRAWMRVETVSLGSERVSLRTGRVTFKIPCFGDLIAGSVASVVGSPCPARSNHPMSYAGDTAQLYIASKSDESKKERITLQAH